MQNDLVRKKDVINLLYELHINKLSVNDKKVTEYIREMPTAYNVEKVVEQLEEEKSDWNYDYNVPITKAIEIVRKGGVEDATN